MRKLTYVAAILFGLIVLKPGISCAILPPPPGGVILPLDTWSFRDTNNWQSDLAFAPVSFTNLGVSLLGDGTALVLDSTNVAWLLYHVTEANGTNNLNVSMGTVMFWFAPSWSGTNEGGTGPGEWGRFIETGAYTTNASYGWWSLYTDPAGANLYFGTQTNNGSGAIYLSAPIAWTTNFWHQIALTYSTTNTALYVDGVLATNGTGLTYWPGPNVLTNGFWIGSDSNGIAQAHGMFDDVATYNVVLDSNTIASDFNSLSFYYYMNPMNSANLLIHSAPSSPTNSPAFRAITGSGFLGPPVTNTSGCVTSSNIWFTNVSATITSTQSVAVTFTIAGGSNNVLYDVFANALMGPTNNTNFAWFWQGQGYHCSTYTLTNLPLQSAYLILGQPTDSDSDGLTDAYERLITHTSTTNADTSGDGMLDGWKVLWGLNPLINNTAQTAERMNFMYDPVGRLDLLFGVRSETVTNDFEDNVLQAH